MFCEFLTIFVTETDMIVDKLIRYIVVTVAVVVIAIASVLQFHHHGCDGVVFIPVYDTDIAIGDVCGHVHEVHDCMAHAHHGHHDDEGKDCSMHIGDTLSPGRVHDHMTVMSVDCVPVIALDISDVVTVHIADLSYVDGAPGVVSPGLLTGNVFRGPPIL